MFRGEVARPALVDDDTDRRNAACESLVALCGILFGTIRLAVTDGRLTSLWPHHNVLLSAEKSRRIPEVKGCPPAAMRAAATLAEVTGIRNAIFTLTITSGTCKALGIGPPLPPP